MKESISSRSRFKYIFVLCIAFISRAAIAQNFNDYTLDGREKIFHARSELWAVLAVPGKDLESRRLAKLWAANWNSQNYVGEFTSIKSAIEKWRTKGMGASESVIYTLYDLPYMFANLLSHSIIDNSLEFTSTSVGGEHDLMAERICQILKQPNTRKLRSVEHLSGQYYKAPYIQKWGIELLRRAEVDPIHSNDDRRFIKALRQQMERIKTYFPGVPLGLEDMYDLTFFGQNSEGKYDPASYEVVPDPGYFTASLVAAKTAISDWIDPPAYMPQVDRSWVLWVLLLMLGVALAWYRYSRRSVSK